MLDTIRTGKPPEAFRTISEASEEIGVAPHVLRFWEGKFSNLRPLKRAGGRRFYRPQDMAILRGLKALLQDDHYTIKGVQKLIKENGIQSVRDRASDEKPSFIDDNVGLEPLPHFAASPEASFDANAETVLQHAVERLEKTVKYLDSILEN